MPEKAPLSYREAGVDIDAGNALVERIRPAARSTVRPGVLAGLGGFGALFALPKDRYREPVLVAGTDGVGTKLKLLARFGRHETAGIDLVAMNVNDVLVQGAEPLFFLDYFATGRLEVEVAARVIEGIAAGCREAGCALIGGETAEMPDFYAPGDYDLAGFCVGAVEREALIDGRAIRAGDLLLGLASSGPHANGFSLIRRILERAGEPFELELDGRPLREALLAPTRIYVRPVLELLGRVEIRGMAHVTGGGLVENIVRVVPPGLALEIEASAWPLPPVFAWLAETGPVRREEMWRTFNCGIGFVLILPEAEAAAAARALAAQGIPSWPIGRVVAAREGAPRVRIG